MTLTLPLPQLAGEYLLDPQIIYLNHGSFGAVPRPVFEAYQHWQRELEANPVEFLGRRAPDLLAGARQRLGAFINASGDDLAFVPNVTYGMNIVARALPLKEGDEILSTDHEYGAIDRAWRFKCEKSGARLVRRQVTLPVTDPQQAAEQIWDGVNQRTKVISLSHITSPTALILPVEEICRRASKVGILTVIDGAHAPGQLDLDMQAIGADFYCGNCHKWLSSARGAGFLFARPDRQNLLEPLVVSHGWRSDSPGQSPFLDNFNWSGTIDPAAYLSVPAAIDFWEQNDWPAVRSACHRILAECEESILALSGLPPISPATMWAQMRLVLLPGGAESYGPRLEENRIIVPLGRQRGHTGIRISVQAYNSPSDLDRLFHVLRDATK